MLRVCYMHIGTVIVRSDMEESGVCCCQREQCQGSECPASNLRTSACEQCTRTRLISQKSDCDSDMDKSRLYTSSAARSRFFKVRAAVCIFLLVSSLPTISKAAPRRSRATMDSSMDSVLWENPCDYEDPTVINLANPREIAPKLIAQTKSALANAEKYKDILAKKLHSYDSFLRLISTWEDSKWLQKFGMRDEIFPKDKKYMHTMSDEYLKKVMVNIDSHLPIMYHSLQLIVAGLNAFSQIGLNDDIINDIALRNNLNHTMHDVRAVLCYFNNFIKGRNIAIAPLKDTDMGKQLPSFTQNNALVEGLLLYRDTLNYLEYLVQIFENLY